jgi:F0F1-type ATP synthase epsilon subunit
MPALLLPDGWTRCKMRRLNSTAGAVERMSHWRETLAAGTAILIAAATASFGQTNVDSIAPTVKTTEREGRIVVSDQQATDLGINIGPGPAAVDRQNLTPAVKERVQRFELSRDAYQREQEQLKKRLNGAATEAERERVRALIKDQREAWLRRMRELHAQSKDRIAELRRQLPSKGEVLDAARENARETIQDIRRRRGQD